MRKISFLFVVLLITCISSAFAQRCSPKISFQKNSIRLSKQGGWIPDPPVPVPDPDPYVPPHTPVVPPAPQVLIPNGNSSWEHGERGCRVEWDGLPGNLIKMELYHGDNLVGEFIGWENNDNSAVRSVTIPSNWGSGIDFRIKVIDNLDNYLWSDWFQISAPIDVSLPNSATRWSTNQTNPTITWSGSEGATVRIELHKGSQLIEVLAANTPNLGTYEFNGTVLARWGTGGGYKIVISDNLQNTYSSQSFYIDPIYISSPSEGEIWYKGRIPESIKWIGGSSVSQVALYRGNSLVTHLTDNWIDNQNEFNITQVIPGNWTDSPMYRVKVTSLDRANNTIVGWSDYFEVRISNDVLDGAAIFATQLSSELARPSDIDYWRFTAENDFIYDFNVNSNTQVKIEVMDRNGSRVLATDGNNGDMNWYCRQSGTYYIRVTALNGTSTGTYTLDLRKKLPPENQRQFSLAGTFGMPVSELSDVITSGFTGSFAYLPVKFVEAGVQFASVTVDKETITDNEALSLNYMGGFIGIRTPELLRISLRGGIGYQGKISDTQVYLRHEYIDYLNSLNNGIRPYYGIDYKMVYSHYGTALFLRLEQVITQGSLGITSVGLNFAF